MYTTAINVHKTQIEAAKTDELEQLAGRIDAELDRRRAQEEADAAREVLASHHTPRGTYQGEMRCGHSERYKKCQAGERHGPYLYRYVYKDGKQSSEYIRLKDAEHLGFSRPVQERA